MSIPMKEGSVRPPPPQPAGRPVSSQLAVRADTTRISSTEQEMDDRTGLARSERVLAGQNWVLRLLAGGQPLEVVLDALCRAHEAVIPSAACSVLLLDAAGERLRHAAAPSLPPDYAAAIDGLRIGPAVGSCGTAAYFGRPVIVEDVDVDPLWADWRELAQRHGLRACWSVPILDREAGQVLGTFAVYYQESRAPAADDLALVERSGDLAGVAIIHARAQAALVAAKEAAERANQAKSAFLAMTSHELRTPLQAVLGYTEFLLADPRASLTAEQREDLGYIEQGGRRMLIIINQMLDLSRIEAGRLELVFKPIDLANVLEEVRQDVAPQASRKGLDLHITVPDAMPPVWGDAERLRQILLNLVGNAVKFTEEGSVEISAGTTTDQVAVIVRDTGCGIAPEALPHIFEAFHQVDNHLARRHGGVGLGLAIAQRLAGLMGGHITVESNVGVGSTFTLQLPAASPARM
jgi:signal transduction histidine kinase